MEANPSNIQEVLLVQRLLGSLPESLSKPHTPMCRQRERRNISRGTLEQHIAAETGSICAENAIVLQVRRLSRSGAEDVSPLLQHNVVSYQLICNHYHVFDMYWCDPPICQNLGSGYMLTDNAPNGILCRKADQEEHHHDPACYHVSLHEM